MDPSLGFKGKACPVTNCYMRGSQGECVANAVEEAKTTSKAMRDTITVVEIIEEARSAPSYAEFTPVTSVGDSRFDRFVREAEISKPRLQFVLDKHPHLANTMQSIIRASE